MNNLIEAFKNDETVKRFIVLRNFILNNDECHQELASKLSRNKAKYTNFKYEVILEEYLELKEKIKSDLEMIKSILENGINEDFAS